MSRPISEFTHDHEDGAYWPPGPALVPGNVLGPFALAMRAEEDPEEVGGPVNSWNEWGERSDLPTEEGDSRG